MSAPKQADVDERNNGRTSRLPQAHSSWPTVAMVALVVLALFSTVVMLVTDSSVWLRVAIGVALWAAVLGAFLIMYYQRRANQFTSRNGLLAEDYQRALQRELDKYDEQEKKRRAEIEEASHEELEQLRQELTALRISLAQLFGPDFEDQLAIGDGQEGYYFDGYYDYGFDGYEGDYEYGDYGYDYHNDGVTEAEVVHDAQVVSETTESAEAEKLRQEETTRLASEARRAEEERKAEQAAEARRRAEEERKAEEARRQQAAAAARKAEEERQAAAKEAALAAEAAKAEETRRAQAAEAARRAFGTSTEYVPRRARRSEESGSTTSTASTSGTAFPSFGLGATSAAGGSHSATGGSHSATSQTPGSHSARRLASSSSTPPATRTSHSATSHSAPEKPASSTSAQPAKTARHKQDSWPDFSTQFEAPVEPDIDWSDLTLDPFAPKVNSTASASRSAAAQPASQQHRSAHSKPDNTATPASRSGGRRAAGEQGAHTSGLSLVDIMKRLEQNK